MSAVRAVPPFRGEFGLTVRYHVPAVHALSRPKVVCIERGMQALYPGAEHVIVERREDPKRKDLYRKDRDYVQEMAAELRDRYPGCTIVAPDRSKDWPESRFTPEPHSRQGVRQHDVVVCPRLRKGGPDTPESKRQDIEVRNWTHWSGLSQLLRLSGLTVFAAGRKETSDTSVSADDVAWRYGRVLDATIEAMLSARLVIATDAGLAHLAVLCGRPLLMITADGRPAPGYPWEVRWQEYYQEANHMGAPLERIDAWGEPGKVADRVLELLMLESVA